MADQGYTRKVAGYVGNLAHGTIVTVDEVRANVIPDAIPAAAPSILSVLARAEDPPIVRERNGVYRVVRGRRGGRPPGSRTQYAPAAPEVREHSETDPAPEPARRPKRRAPQQVPAPVFAHAVDLLLTFLRGLPDGSALYLDDATSGIYKVVKIG